MSAPLLITPYKLAERYLGVAELKGVGLNHPLIVWWLSLCGLTAPGSFTGLNDEIPWCSAFCNGMFWELRLNRSKSARARSWLEVGTPILLTQAEVGFDLVILNRGGSPDPDVIASPGHVGFYASHDAATVTLLGGNQGNKVGLARFPQADILGVRRLI